MATYYYIGRGTARTFFTDDPQWAFGRANMAHAVKTNDKFKPKAKYVFPNDDLIGHLANHPCIEIAKGRNPLEAARKLGLDVEELLAD